MDEPEPGEIEVFLEQSSTQRTGVMEPQNDSTLDDLKSFPRKISNVVKGTLFLNDKPNQQSKSSPEQNLVEMNEVNIANKSERLSLYSNGL